MHALALFIQIQERNAEIISRKIYSMELKIF
jgi:hypothetical protein